MIPPQEPGCWYGMKQYQGIELAFDNGEKLFFAVAGQQKWGNIAYITVGEEYRINIFEAFRRNGVVFNEPVNLLSIQIGQQLQPYCDPNPPVDNIQRMDIDYIRIEER